MKNLFPPLKVSVNIELVYQCNDLRRYTPPRIHGRSKYESDERRTASEVVIVLHAPGLPQQLKV